MRDKLIEAYLDFFNNYLSYEKYAEHNGLTGSQAVELLSLAKAVYKSQHPDQ